VAGLAECGDGFAGRQARALAQQDSRASRRHGPHRYAKREIRRAG
jgi:hypothetical protein